MPPPSPPLLILIVPTIAFFLWLIANPSFLSSTTTTTTHRVRPGSVHKGWDSLNIFLVLFAILCGVFARKNDDDSSDNINRTTGSRTGDLNYKPLEDQKRTVSNPPSWFDQSSNDRIFATPRLKRSSSSYPNLRQESWVNHLDDDQRFRFFDDFEISSKLYTSSPSSEILNRRNRSRSFEESNVKEIPVDTFVLRSSLSLRSPSPPPPSKSPSPVPTPPPPPPPPPRRRVYKTVPRKEKLQRPTEPPTPPPPPPPPPGPPPSPRQEKKYVKSERKRTNATKEIRMVLASLYNQRKRKKKQRSMQKNTCDDVSASLRSPNTETTSNTRPRPSPPPPPPPPSMFHSLFRKGSKSKKIHSFSAPPPPPPPPLSSRNLSKRKTPAPPPPAPPTQPRRYSTSTGRPPLPTRANNFYDDNVNSGGQSPLIPMPPPPPPPPFKVQGFRFVVTGDFVKIRSASSSRCGSPEREEVENDVTAGPGGVGGGASVFVRAQM